MDIKTFMGTYFRNNHNKEKMEPMDAIHNDHNFFIHNDPWSNNEHKSTKNNKVKL